MQETREQILTLLQHEGESDVQGLAEALSLSIPTIRHHLTILERDALINRQPLRGQVGRPKHVFSLSSKGQAQFPKRYAQLSLELLTEIKATYGCDSAEPLLERMAKRLLRERQVETADKGIEARADALVQLLNQDGFVAEWEMGEDVLTLTQHTCPYQAVAQQHAEVCRFDTALIEGVLDQPVRRTQCLRDGDPACTFHALP
jgi:predicted ArsR family transcriptional regulator